MDDSENIFRLIAKLENRINNSIEGKIYDEEFFKISCTILRIVYRNLDPAGRVMLEFIDTIDENIEDCRKEFIDKIGGGGNNSYSLANQLPLFIVNMISSESAGTLIGKDFAPMIKNPKSYVRACTFHTLWIIRDRLDNQGVIQGLLYNLAENLGYIDEAAGLLRGILGDDGRLFLAASKYDASTKRKEQFEYRIDQIRSKNLLPACMQSLISFENEIALLESL